jgi:hypothetical protein
MVSNFSPTLTTISHAHQLLNPRCTTRSKIANNLLLPLIFFLLLRVSVGTRACMSAHGHAEAGKEDKGEDTIDCLFVLLSKREMCPHNAHLLFPQMRDTRN